MEFKELIRTINSSVDELDLVTARRLIEHNIEILQEHKSHLNRNSRELLNFSIDSLNSGNKMPSRNEMATIQTVNQYASSFNLRGIKLIIKEKSTLFLRKDIVTFLNKDAKTILEGMGAIPES
ncbi:hypothetical protein [Salinibacillus xinjiangensis]|uniref:Uncharacterized protein n=1 Tax=Salinibacillus xinjiangensis TaxID=1229268 RepID=A0A6G1X887_9BACI|nr:hypothetical protein [Salinibacillus xinjiangensis]MRG87018.1 hypothetical protein [Salinibacillus xinjiangensis]